jgi:hypothetical protein
MPYTPHPHHRDGAYAAQKSQWCITVNEEQACYLTAAAETWTSGGSYWGLHVVNEAPAVLGVAPLPAEAPLKIAKFVEDQNDWHGYPVAHWLSPYDKPGANVLREWVNKGLIRRPTMAKVHRGKRCSL